MNDAPAFGMLLPTRDGGDWEARRLVDLAVVAEKLGFASVWAGESPRLARHEPLTLLAAVASATTHVALGTAALMPTVREPVSLARAIASLDQLCQGRLMLGVGAGYPNPGTKAAFAMANIPFQGRSARLDETVALWRHLWSDRGSEPFHGEIFHYDWLPEPLPTHHRGGPPIWLAAGASSACERAGQSYNGWLPYPPSVDEYAAGNDLVTRAARNSGRDPSLITRALFATVFIDPDVERARHVLDEYCTSLYGLALGELETIQTWLIGSPEDVGVELARYAKAGAKHFVIRIGGVDPTPQLEPLADLLFNTKGGVQA
jgi:alkanesulfonate monooxygenase SsuD/methylene tetrahydromethanopterin reductase-like flavin-dependent oxidoreductase (luciferase family)